MNIKRFEPVEDGIHPYNTGDYVLYRDHIAALEAVKATKVRELEWISHEAQTELGRYSINRMDGHWEVMFQAGFHASCIKSGTAASFDQAVVQAKAAAQADYETRILSAIVPSPALEANRLAEKIEDLIEEFGDDPKAALDCISEWINFSRQNPSPALEANQQVIETLRAEIERLLTLIRWAHETLYEINPSNYDHDEVCKLNDASVEVILGLAPTLGETHGQTAEWWRARAALTHPTQDEVK